MLCQLGTQHVMTGQAVLPYVLSHKKSLQALPINLSLRNESSIIVLPTSQKLPLKTIL